jgi:hypothetical protein
MTDYERDPAIQNLFATAEQDLGGERFVAKVMQKAGSTNRYGLAGADIVRIGWVVASFVLFVWLVQAPLQSAIRLLSAGLTRPLLDLGDTWFLIVLAPVNTAGSLFALGLLGFALAFRRIFT